eukprot:403357658
MNSSKTVLLQSSPSQNNINNNKYDRCKVLIKCEPPIVDLSLDLTINQQENGTLIFQEKEDGSLETSLFYPQQMIQDNCYLSLMSSLDELAKIDLQKLQFDATTDQTIEKSYQINYLGKQHAVRVYFELQSTSKSEEEQQQQEYLTIDISVSSIPIKQKCFSCFPSIPLAYYEILGYSQNSKTIKAGTAEPKVLYQSEITRLPSQDPVWMPTQKLNKLHLQPYFRVNVYNSADHAKSRERVHV